MWSRIVTDGHPHHKPEVWPMCRGQMHSGRWRSLGLCHIRVCPSLTYRQNLHSSMKITECHSSLQLTLSWHQSSRAWWCCGISGSLVRGRCDLSPAASRRFPAMGLFIDVIFYLTFSCCSWEYILKFCHLKIVSGAMDTRKWSAKWRNWNISDIFFSCLVSTIPFFSLC